MVGRGARRPELGERGCAASKRAAPFVDLADPAEASSCKVLEITPLLQPGHPHILATLIFMYVGDVQPNPLADDRLKGAQSIVSSSQVTSLPQKVGNFEVMSLGNLLNTWSGRRDSNPRRPAWEIRRRLKNKENGVYGGSSRCKEISNFLPIHSLTE